MGIKEDWEGFDKKTKIGFGGAIAFAVLWGIFGSLIRKPDAEPAPQRAPAPAMSGGAVGAGAGNADPFNARVLPDTPRNQGLENLKLDLDNMRADMSEIRRALGLENRNGTPIPRPAPPSAPASAAQATGLPLDTPLPPPAPVDTRALEVDQRQNALTPTLPAGRAGRQAGAELPLDAPARKQLKVWAEEGVQAMAKPVADAALVIPANSAFEGVMLSGFNARPSGAITAAVGSVSSANSVGAPFVSRLKGEAILPNSWKVPDLGDCFLGGSATAVLSAERAYSIAKSLSCVTPSGEVFEGEVKAYGLDVDGTLGLACKVVSKQGSLIAQAALTGIVGGLGAAFTPQQIPSYATNATGGQATYQLPNPRMLVDTAVGQGVEKAASQLSKFYLDYAKEVFPVCEVTSGTRITWVLQEALELRRRPLTGRAGKQPVSGT